MIVTKKDKKTFRFIDLYNILERRCIYSSEKGSQRATPRSGVLARLASLAQIGELARRLWKGVPFVNESFTKQGPFLSKMDQKWYQGAEPPCIKFCSLSIRRFLSPGPLGSPDTQAKNFVEYPLPFPRGGVQLFQVFQTVVLLSRYTVESRFLERSVCWNSR